MKTLRYILAALALVTISIGATGCGFGAILGKAIPQNTAAAYPGLAGQTVGILVWADRGISIDWGSIQLDLANSVQARLTSSQAEEMKGTNWPYPPASYVKFMRDHPGLDSAPITEIAPKFGLGRLIYIEVQNFRTRSSSELELFRGEATMSLKIVEINGDAARVAYTEDNIKAVFPTFAPPDGLPTLGDNKTYLGTVDEMALQIANRLVTHETEPERGQH